MFEKSAVGWQQAAELQGADTVGGDPFGWSVAISGNSAIVGSYQHGGGPGQVFFFSDGPGGWGQVAERAGSDPVDGDSFGWSVALSGATAIVGATYPPFMRGRAFVFTDTGSLWSQAAFLTG